MSSLKIIFAGTPEFSLPTLVQLQESNHEIVAVLTQPDRPAGRGRKLRASPIKVYAVEQNLTVLQPLSLKEAEIQLQLKSYSADLMVVVAYGLILPEAVLSIPKYGCFNIHASLLPRWRGAAPIHRAILAGDSESGITIMQMDKGLDTGDMLAIQTCEIGAVTRTVDLHDELASMGAALLLNTVDQLGNDALQPVKQDSSTATYAKKLSKAEAQINWQDSSQQIDQMVRAFNPWPVAQTKFKDKVMKVWSASLGEKAQSELEPGTVVKADKSGIHVQTGDGLMVITELQLSGSKRMSVEAFLNAHAVENNVLK